MSIEKEKFAYYVHTLSEGILNQPCTIVTTDDNEVFKSGVFGGEKKVGDVQSTTKTRRAVMDLGHRTVALMHATGEFFGHTDVIVSEEITFSEELLEGALNRRSIKIISNFGQSQRKEDVVRRFNLDAGTDPSKISLQPVGWEGYKKQEKLLMVDATYNSLPDFADMNMDALPLLFHAAGFFAVADARAVQK